MRGDQLARQWRLLKRIEAGRRGVTVARLAEYEEITLRTAYRDLESLQEAGFPLYTEKSGRAQRWFLMNDYSFDVPQPFTLTELMSLHIYEDLIRVFQGTMFYDSLESLFKKVRASLPPQTLAFLDRVRSTFKVGIKPYKDYGRFREILTGINRAALNRSRIEIVYHALKSPEETVRKVDPYRIWFFEGTIYLIGYCHLRGDMRVFVLDRIRKLRETEESFEIPDSFDLQEFIGDSFRVMRGETHLIRIRISPDWARYVGERIWHESQRTVELPGGGLEISFRAAGLEEIRGWVLSLGPEAEVLEPRELRKMMIESLDKTRAAYRTSSPDKNVFRK